ncbi:MAG: DNA recombination protein RmuC [Actinomycetota bacterium]
MALTTILVMTLIVACCLALGYVAGKTSGRAKAEAQASETSRELTTQLADITMQLAHTREQLAAAGAERDGLRARVHDLQSDAKTDGDLLAALSPLRETLTRVERNVGTLERDRVEQYAKLGEQLGTVAQASDLLREQTASLAGALRSSSTRGTWGETQLRRVVEYAGLLSRVDFTEQATATTAEGATVRPDLVIHLPGGKHLVIDAKAPLSAFLDAGATDDDTARNKLLAAHAKALRGHMDVLAGRAYWEAFAPTPEMVVCFVPGDAILTAALSADPGLHERAMAQRVVLVSPATLLALLRTVAFTWQQDALAGNARELFEVGRELYGRLSTLGGHTRKLGRTLHSAIEDYNKMVGTLERRVLVTARKMNDLDLTDNTIDELSAIDNTPRILTAVELLDDIGLVNGDPQGVQTEERVAG